VYFFFICLSCVFPQGLSSAGVSLLRSTTKLKLKVVLMACFFVGVRAFLSFENFADGSFFGLNIYFYIFICGSNVVFFLQFACENQGHGRENAYRNSMLMTRTREPASIANNICGSVSDFGSYQDKNVSFLLLFF
jgi:hypothetical protein